MARIDVSIKRLDPSVELPQYAYEGDAGLDLRANESVDIAPYERVLIHTGIAIALPDGYAGFVQPRSGMALKRGLSIVNTPGLIDAHYRGELMVIAINLDAHEPIHIERGERIAQLVIQEVPTVRLVEVDELDRTDRAAGCFGLCGAKCPRFSSVVRITMDRPACSWTVHCFRRLTNMCGLIAPVKLCEVLLARSSVAD